MTQEECERLVKEYFFLVGSEYLDRQTGCKCQLASLTIMESLTTEGDYFVMCELINRTSMLIGSKVLIKIDSFLNTDRFLRIRMAPSGLY